MYWQVELAPSPSGTPDRLLTCRKRRGPGRPVLWREVDRAEQQLLGIQYAGRVPEPHPMIVRNAGHWLWEATGAHEGDEIEDLVAGEADRYFRAPRSPSTTNGSCSRTARTPTSRAPGATRRRPCTGRRRAPGSSRPGRSPGRRRWTDPATSTPGSSGPPPTSWTASANGTDPHPDRPAVPDHPAVRENRNHLDRTTGRNRVRIRRKARADPGSGSGASAHRQGARAVPERGGRPRDGRQRPHLRLRLGAADRDPRQGPGPHPALPVVVRPARRPGPEPRPEHRAAPRRPRRLGGPRAGLQVPADGPRGVRGPRLPSPARGWPSTTRPVPSAASRSPRASSTARNCPPRSSPRPPRPRSASTTRTSPTRRSPARSARTPRPPCARPPSPSTPAPGTSPATAASSWRTPSSSSASRAERRRPRPRRRGTHPGLLRFWPADQWQPGRAQRRRTTSSSSGTG